MYLSKNSVIWISLVLLCVVLPAGSTPQPGAPTFSKAFSSPTVPLNGTTTLTFTVVNPNPVALTGLAFTDLLPAGLIVATPNGLTNTCGGTLTAVAGSGSVTLTGGTVAASSTCTMSVNVAAISAGAQNNTTSTLTSNAPPAAAATASIFVTAPPLFSKAFGQATIFAGTTTTLTFTIQNTNAVALTGLAFTDPLPVGLAVATPNGLTDTCGGTVTATPGSNSISLSGGTVAAGATCTITVSVAGVSPGKQVNTTSTLTSNEASAAAAATATIFVVVTLDGSFQVSYATNPSVGDSFVNIINTGANGAPLLGPGLGAITGNTCVNIYAFDSTEEMISCCSCLLTPNQVVSLGAYASLTIKSETGVVPPFISIKLLNTLAGPTGAATACTNSATAAGGAGFPIVNGMVAYGTTPQPVGSVYNAVEHPFIPSTLGAAELASLTNRCANIVGNASGYGVCMGCRAGALGAAKQ